MQYLIHLKDCFKRVPLDMQQNLAQLREVVEKMRAIIPEGKPFVGNHIFTDLKTDSDHILAELKKLQRETNILIHEVISPEFPYFWVFVQPDNIGTDLI